GTLYVLEDGEAEAPTLAAARGVEASRLPPDLRPDRGLAGRAFAQRSTVAADHGQAGMTVAAFGEEVAVGAELHVPLLNGERALGMATLVRLAARPFSAAERALAEHLATQAGVALANALSYATAVRLLAYND